VIAPTTFPERRAHQLPPPLPPWQRKRDAARPVPRPGRHSPARRPSTGRRGSRPRVAPRYSPSPRRTIVTIRNASDARVRWR